MRRVILLFLLLGINVAFSQERYVDDIFQDNNIVEVDSINYGQNIPYPYTKLDSNPPMEQLYMNIYMPDTSVDTSKSRWVIILIPAGSFLPSNFQQKQPLGTLYDNWLVEACKAFAKKGYVAIALTHRLGWNPLANSQEEKAKSIMRAVWRAQQDLRAAVRYLRKSVAVNNNPYKIAPNKIVAGGSSSGGYVALHAAILDDDELTLPKFVDQNGDPFIDTTALGNAEGESGNPGYSSRINALFTLGAAVGDTNFQDVGDPPMVAVHGTDDQTTPYGTSLVVTAVGSYPIIEVSGSKDFIRKATTLGNQDVLISKGIKDALDTDGIMRPGLKPYQGLGFEFYSWYDGSTQSEIDQAKQYLYDIIAFAAPRLKVIFDPNYVYSSIKKLNKNIVKIYPTIVENNKLYIQVKDKSLQINEVNLCSLTGQILNAEFQNNMVEIPVNVAPGFYIVKIETNKGTIEQKVVIK